MTKLRYHLKDGKKIYTLKESVDDVQTKDAHYKFIKIRGIKEKALNKEQD
ncbi:MAG: hypothetical protein Q8L29_00740 [archaeon]|nr:hypothetical protein [archaeon]